MADSGDDGEIVSRSEIIGLFGSDIVRNGQWLMRWCPAHADGTKHGRRGKAGRSLGLSDEGRLKCFAGCKFGPIMDGLRAENGVTRIDAPRPARGPRRPDWAEDEELTAVYDYRDADGRLVAQKARIDKRDKSGKRFTWRDPGVKGWPPKDYGGGTSTPMEDMPLWGSELVSAADPKQWVFFVEGEKAAEACRARGFLAVTHGGGAGTRRFGKSLEVLRDRKVALWPDNDEVGFKYMAAVARLLGPLVRQVRFVTVPVGEKQDAFDFFAAGGKPEDVFKTVWDEPVTEFLGSDHVRVTTFTSIGPVLYDFSELSHERGALNCELDVSLLAPGMEGESLASRQNLLSSSAREGLERMLKKQFGDANWTLSLSQSYKRARDAFNQQDRGFAYGTIGSMPALDYIVDGLLLRNSHTILFGDGSSGKTMWAYALALCVAMGIDFCGAGVTPSPVMVVDYETKPEISKWRMHRLLKGMGLEPSVLDALPIFYWPAEGIPLREQADAIRRFAKKNEVEVLLVDSGGVACGGPPEKSEAALGYFAGALKTCVPTVLTICHVSHTSDGMYPFGSKFWHNMARSTAFMQASGIGTDDITLSYFPRKENETKRGAQSNFKLHFGSGGDSEITIQRVANRVAPVAPAEVDDKVWAVVKMAPGRKAYEIARELGMSGEAIGKVLALGQGKSFEYRTDMTVAGAVRTWYALGDKPPSLRSAS